MELVKKIKPSIFLPICLYSKNYKLKENVKYVFKNYIIPSKSSLILICDDLHAYNLIIRGIASQADAFIKAKMQGENLKKMILNVKKKFTELENFELLSWNDLSSQFSFKRILTGVEDHLYKDSELEKQVIQFIITNIQKFNGRVNLSNKKWERRYLLEEIAMSIYVTEIKGYWLEFWDSPPDPHCADPIGFLYKERPDIVKRLVGKNKLNRKLRLINFPSNETEISNKYDIIQVNI